MEDKIAVVAIAKDEDNYLAEWADYHLLLGFDDVYVWQNNWRSKLAGKLGEHVHFKVIDGNYKQIECYNTAIAELHEKHQWLAFFDVDEFLSLNDQKFSSVKQYLAQDKFANVPALCVNWRVFGDSGLQRVESFSVLERFTKCSSKLDETSKVMLHTGVARDSAKFFFNPHCVTCMQHDPDMKFALNQIGNNKKVNEFHQQASIELNHYRNKTYAERFAKCFQQPSVAADPNYLKHLSDIAEFNAEFDKCNLNEVVNTVARDFYAKAKSSS